MGPMQALVALAEREDLHPFLEEMKASESIILVAVHVDDKGNEKTKLLSVGNKVTGYVKLPRTGLDYVPRPFRDEWKYTGSPGKQRDAYARVVQQMVDRHPRSKALTAFHKFLTSKRTLKDFSTKKGVAYYIPFYKNRPIIRAIESDLDGARTDPYGHQEGRAQDNVVLGGECFVSRRRPIRLTKIGDSNGVTLMSTNDDVTGMNGCIGNDRYLQIPVDQYTMNMHVHGLNWLLNHGEVSWPAWGESRLASGTLCYVGWCPDGTEPDVERTVMDVLRGLWPRPKPKEERTKEDQGICLDDLERFAERMRKRTDPFYLLGIREDRRPSLVGWYTVPLNELAQNLLAYARQFHLDDGRVLGLLQMATSCASLDQILSDDKYIGLKDHKAFAYKQCHPEIVMALVDHIIEGHPFPIALSHRVRVIYGTQNIPAPHTTTLTINRFLDIQERIIEASCP